MTRSGFWWIRLLRVVLALALVMLVVAGVGAALGVVMMLPFIERMPAMVDAMTTTPAARQFVAMIGSRPSRLVLCGVLPERFAIAVVVVGALSRMLRDAARGRAFTAANTGRLRAIAACCGVSFLSRFVVPPLAPVPVRAWLDSTGWSFDAGDLVPLLGALVLAEVFREGIRLREEAELTV